MNRPWRCDWKHLLVSLPQQLRLARTCVAKPNLYREGQESHETKCSHLSSPVQRACCCAIPCAQPADLPFQCLLLSFHGDECCLLNTTSVSTSTCCLQIASSRIEVLTSNMFENAWWNDVCIVHVGTMQDVRVFYGTQAVLCCARTSEQ